MLLHNLYAIATPGTWQGSPDADPCAVIPGGDPDAAPTPMTDAGPSAGGDAGPDDETPPGGCGCQLTTGGSPTGLLIGLAFLWTLRRRRAAAGR
jgi:uncharacterized protein (TIGR03382 family)